MQYFHVTARSQNKKTGPMPVTTSDKSTCPSSCPLSSVCYADRSKLYFHWRDVSSGKRGHDWSQFLRQLEAALLQYPVGQLWRANQAGDLPGSGDCIDPDKLRDLADLNARMGASGFTYTHKPLTGANLRAVRSAIRSGFTINASCETLAQADRAMSVGIPAVVVVPLDYPAKGVKTAAGRPVVVCPAQIQDSMTCARCGLCSKAARSSVVAFRAHGSGAFELSAKLRPLG